MTDNFLLMGREKECICGWVYRESDGHGCHALCKECLQMISYNEFEDYSGLCEKCYNERLTNEY